MYNISKIKTNLCIEIVEVWEVAYLINLVHEIFHAPLKFSNESIFWFFIVTKKRTIPNNPHTSNINSNLTQH